MTYAEIRAGATYRGKDGQPDRTVANLFTDWQGVAWVVCQHPASPLAKRYFSLGEFARWAVAEVVDAAE
jgi:hypothetical protein